MFSTASSADWIPRSASSERDGAFELVSEKVLSFVGIASSKETAGEKLEDEFASESSPSFDEREADPFFVEPSAVQPVSRRDIAAAEKRKNDRRSIEPERAMRSA